MRRGLAAGRRKGLIQSPDAYYSVGCVVLDGTRAHRVTIPPSGAIYTNIISRPSTVTVVEGCNDGTGEGEKGWHKWCRDLLVVRASPTRGSGRPHRPLVAHPLPPPLGLRARSCTLLRRDPQKSRCPHVAGPSCSPRSTPWILLRSESP